MKFCPGCQQVYPDSARVCSICDRVLVVIFPNLSEQEVVEKPKKINRGKEVRNVRW